MITHKTCKECGQLLEIVNFTKSKSVKDGYENKCKKCRREARKKFINTCLICEKKFKTGREEGKFCSVECQGIAKRNRVNVKCSFCNKDIEIIKSRKDNNDHYYCDKYCRAEHLKILMKGDNNPNYSRVQYFCDGCKREIVVLPRKIENQKYIFCSNECYVKNIGNLVVGYDNYVDENHRRCSCCNEVKELTEFYKDKNSYDRKCKKCKYKESSKRYSHVCSVCGSDFTSEKRRVKFCSKKCANNGKLNRKVTECDYCGKIIDRPASQYNGKESVYCSRECQHKGWSILYSGENSPLYNHNKPIEERLIERKYIDYYEWRKQVYQKDNYTCQCCGDDRGGNLVAHHILNYSEHIQLRTEIPNGITLCKTCHKSFHDTYGYRNNNKEQIEEFLENKKVQAS